MITLHHYLGLSAVLFTIGLVGVISRRNIILLLLSLEILLSAVNLCFVAFSRAAGNLQGQIMVFFVMIVAAAEVTVGLAIAMVFVRLTGAVNSDALRNLRR